MKILEANAGPLTNFEVLEFFKSKGASKDPTRVLAKVAQSEYKVYDYLVETPASNQKRESIDEFLTNCRKYDLSKAEVLNIINLRPATAVEIFPIIENCDMRFSEEEISEMIELVDNTLPPPVEPKPEGNNEDNGEVANTEQNVNGNETTQDEKADGQMQMN